MLAFVFPGQGSQSLGMLAELAARDPVVQRTFDEASTGAGVDLWKLSQAGPAAELDRTELTQPALLAAGVAVWRAWIAARGPSPVALAGHSLGEYAALVCADAIPLGDAAALVRTRGQLMQAAVPAGTGAMAAVLGADDDVVAQACADAAGDGVVAPANFNSPGQVVISGDAAAVDRAIALLAERGVRKCVRLPVSVPSHCALMRGAAQELAARLESIGWREPRLPVVQNVDARAHGDVASIKHALVEQLHRPVRWTAVVEALRARGVTRLAECGPGKVLSGLAKRIDRSLEARALGTPAELDSALTEWRTE